MAKRIFIVANFCGQLNGNDNNRFVYLASLLSSKYDCCVELITSSFIHEKKEKRTLNEMYPFKITIIDEPPYKKNVSVKRLISHYKWGDRVYRYLKNSSVMPDVIYCAVPSLTAPHKISKFCKKNKIKFIIDIQDLWPQAFKIALNIPIISNLVFLPIELYANHIYRNADTICGVSETYVKKGLEKNKKGAKGCAVYLGTELVVFDNSLKCEPSFIRQKSDICLCYCGTLGASYDLKCVFEAMKIVNDDRLRLIVMGDGPKKTVFEKMADLYKIRVDFLGRLPYKTMCRNLVECDITVNPIVERSVATIINKHADYAAAGLPVLNTQANKEYVDLIDIYGMGMSSRPGDSEELAKNILLLINNEKMRQDMGSKSRLCAVERFDRAKTYKALVEAILA